MVETTLSKNPSKLEINDYDWNSGEKISDSISFKRFPEKLNFFREKDNHSYVRGEVNYRGECRNNLIISPYEVNILNNVKNALIFVDSYKINLTLGVKI